MKKRRYLPPLMHSDLSDEENLASRFDPNGSYTGTPSDAHPVPDSINDTAPHTQPDNDTAASDKIRYKSAATPSSEGYVRFDVANPDGAPADVAFTETPDGKPDLTYSEDAILPDCPMPEGWNGADSTSFTPRPANGAPSAPNNANDTDNKEPYGKNGRDFVSEPSIPDGELPINMADRPAVPVQDVDDL